MEPLYSILLCNQPLVEYEEKINSWLSQGIKVLWFSQNEEDIEKLNREYRDHLRAFILQTYVVSFVEKVCIIDGNDSEGFLEKYIRKGCPLFNSEQYLVEHCYPNEHIVVQASAGTGKTTVMIDRIMFLLHTQPDLHLSDVYMVTFTNDATNQMNRRLQSVLMTRYELTHDKRYLRWLEEQSSMNISTLHSFAYQMLQEYGIEESFTKNLSIRSFKNEKNDIVKNAVDSRIDESRSIKDQLGVPFYKANTIIGQFWNSVMQLGVSHEDLLNMDWGKPANKQSEAFQSVLRNLLPELDNNYFDVKRLNEGVSVNDIMRDLQEVLKEEELPTPDLKMKYLFIDEFQDSDLSQIMVACLLIIQLNAMLFVVGDVKQSIYRFRGANDQAFNVLEHYMSRLQIKSALQFELVNNYRTSAEVINKMDTYFRVWGAAGYLQYDKTVIPFKRNDGNCKMLYVASERDNKFDEKVAEIASESLNHLIERVDENKQTNDSDRVVILTRTHKESRLAANILRRNKIPVMLKEEGSFYVTEAVRDFYMLVSSFMFPDEPKYIFNYLLTPYAGEIDPLDINSMEMLHGDYDNLVDYLNHFLDQTSWKKYHKDFRLKPVLSVFKEIFDGISILDNYIINKKAILKDLGWEESRINAQVHANARKYQANVEKLMDIIQRNLGGSKVSIYDVYNFLKLNIATNRSESEAEVETSDDYRTVLCMTVHKAKGLEFDTVFLPYTNRSFSGRNNTELLVDSINNKIGWHYTGDKEKKNKRWKYDEMQNNYYAELKAMDNMATAREETRILYVAMTRAIHNFICFVPPARNEYTWAHLLEEVGVDYE